MPELPEVETIKLQLNKVLPGLKIVDVEVRTPKIFHGDENDLVGLRVDKVERMGKMLCLKLKSKNEKGKTTFKNLKLRKEERGIFLLVHLKMTGRLIFNQTEYEKDKHTHVVIKFSNGKKLYFWDMRKFGWVKIIENLKFKIENLKIGKDPLTRDFTRRYFASILKKSKKPIKVLLIEQDKISGVGNIYANEALFCAKIRPKRPAFSLTDGEAEKLYECVRRVLQKGLKYKGASENSFRLIDGSKGRMQEHFWVYQRHGKLCPKCGQEIRRIELGGRGTFYCERCQR